jgi:mono/diheme cytochrome c family protein
VARHSSRRQQKSILRPYKLIAPGSPETSRFLIVTKLSDHEISAMPPTGHALSKKQVELLSAWIQQGAPLPKENVSFNSQGESPRSR